MEEILIRLSNLTILFDTVSGTVVLIPKDTCPYSNPTAMMTVEEFEVIMRTELMTRRKFYEPPAYEQDTEYLGEVYERDNDVDF
jgi:hypothetical protein